MIKKLLIIICLWKHKPLENLSISCFRKTGVSHIFPKPHTYAIIESKKVLKKQHLKGEEKCRKSK